MRFLEGNISVKSVVFSENNDTKFCYFKKSKSYVYFDDNNEVLATSLLLSIRNGIPMVLNSSVNEYINYGIYYKNMMKKLDAPDATISPIYSRSLTYDVIGDVVLISRGVFGFSILNKSDKDLELNTIYIDTFNIELDGEYFQVNGDIPDSSVNVSLNKMHKRYRIITNLGIIKSKCPAFYIGSDYTPKNDYSYSIGNFPLLK